jgi:hypothetical protein
MTYLIDGIAVSGSVYERRQAFGEHAAAVFECVDRASRPGVKKTNRRRRRSLSVVQTLALRDEYRPKFAA